MTPDKIMIDGVDYLALMKKEKMIRPNERPTINEMRIFARGFAFGYSAAMDDIRKAMDEAKKCPTTEKNTQ